MDTPKGHTKLCFCPKLNITCLGSGQNNAHKVPKQVLPCGYWERAFTTSDFWCEQSEERDYPCAEEPVLDCSQEIFKSQQRKIQRTLQQMEDLWSAPLFQAEKGVTGASGLFGATD